MRVLQIAKYFAPDEGGIETVTRAVCEGLHAAGHQPDVLCFSRRATYPEQRWPWAVHRVPLGPMIGDRPLSLTYAREVGRLAPHYDVGLLHLPNPIGAAAVLAAWDKPLVVLWHADGTKWPAVNAVLNLLNRAVLRRAAAVTMPSRAHVEGSPLRELLTPKAAIIPFPFDPAWLDPAPATSPLLERISAFARGRHLILAVGRLVPYKGFDRLIEAARLLDPGLAVVIAGGGPLAAELAARVEGEGVQDRVLMAGRVSSGELRALYERVSVVTMPSVTRQEMYGLTQVEALCFGRPLVSTRIPFSGVPEVNIDGETGLVVPPGDVPALADALNRIGTDADLHARMASAARRQFERQHQVDVFGQRYARLLEAAAARG